MSPSPTESPPPLSTLAIVGVGLIGGSVALAARKHGLARRIIGVGRSLERLQAAQHAGLLDDAAVDPPALGEGDLAVICTPVDHIAQDVRALAARGRPGLLLTDAGSTKGRLCRNIAGTLPAGIEFVGAHPLAGSEKTGWEYATNDLLNGRLCVLTPTGKESTAAQERIHSFWSRLEMRTQILSPEEHDHQLALTSHLPHVAAAALTILLEESSRPFAASGFRDTTRIAAGDPDLWTAIFLQNAGPLTERINQLIARLELFRDAAAEADAPALRALLAKAKTSRDALPGEP